MSQAATENASCEFIHTEF